MALSEAFVSVGNVLGTVCYVLSGTESLDVLLSINLIPCL